MHLINDSSIHCHGLPPENFRYIPQPQFQLQKKHEPPVRYCANVQSPAVWWFCVPFPHVLLTQSNDKFLF